jgi:hypothetical protein
MEDFGQHVQQLDQTSVHNFLPCPSDAGFQGQTHAKPSGEDSFFSAPRRLSFDALFQQVRDRTSVYGTFQAGSHVMQYGQLDIDSEDVAEYIGSDPANDKASGLFDVARGNVLQRDADLLHLWHKVRRPPSFF